MAHASSSSSSSHLNQENSWNEASGGSRANDSGYFRDSSGNRQKVKSPFSFGRKLFKPSAAVAPALPPDLFAGLDTPAIEQWIKSRLLSSTGRTYSDEEEKLFAKSNQYVAPFGDAAAKSTFDVLFPSIQFKQVQGISSENCSVTFNEMSTIIRASSADVLSRRLNPKFWSLSDVGMFPSVLSRVNDHHLVATSTTSKVPAGFQPRLFVNSMVWARADEPKTPIQMDERLDVRGRSYILVIMPTSHPASPEASDGSVVRGQCVEVCHVVELAPDRTQVKSYVYVDLKLPFSKHMNSSWLNSSFRAEYGERFFTLKESFQKSRPLELLDEEDGKILGETLLRNTKLNINVVNAFNNSDTIPSSSVENTATIATPSPPFLLRLLSTTPRYDIRASITRTVADYPLSLGRVAAQHPSFVPLLCAVMSSSELGSLRSGSGHDCSKVLLTHLSAEEGLAVGHTLAFSLLSNVSPQAAVEEWVLSSASLREYRRRFPWFQPLIIALASARSTTDNWSLALRLVLGLVLSTADIVTDIYMILKYMEDNERGFAYINISCVALCYFCQFFIILVQNKNSPQIVVRETFILIVGLKPAVDAYRMFKYCSVGSDGKTEETLSFDLYTEVNFCKGAEVIVESLPCICFQSYAFMRGKSKGVSTLISISVSLLSSAFITASINWDFDIDPSRRSFQPLLYGYVPDHPRRRAMLFLAMISLSFFQAIARVLTLVLIFLVSPPLLGLFMGVDFAIFFLYKLFRRDFLYWMAPDVILSLIIRGIRKALSDFTFFPQERNPFDQGGLWFLVSIVTVQIGPYLALTLFFNVESATVFAGTSESDAVEFQYFVEHQSERNGMNRSVLTTLIVTSTSLWVLSAVSFFVLMKPEFRRTFYSSLSSFEYTRDTFRHPEVTDEGKLHILFKNKLGFYRRFENETKEFIVSSYPRWVTEQKPWWNERVLLKIPQQLLPAEAAEHYALIQTSTQGRKNSQRARRKESVFRKMSRSHDLLADERSDGTDVSSKSPN